MFSFLKRSKNTRNSNKNTDLSALSRHYTKEQLIQAAIYLSVLRRELANLTIEKFDDRLISFYEKIIDFENNVKNDPSLAEAELNLLVKKYNSWSYYDLISTRFFIPYQSALEIHNIEEIFERLNDISKMIVLINISTKTYNTQHDREELSILLRTIRHHKDLKLRFRLEEAYNIHSALRAYLYKIDAKLPSYPYDHDDFTIMMGANMIANEYLIKFKNDNQYGIYEYFVDNNGEIYRSYYRSDEYFKNREIIFR